MRLTKTLLAASIAATLASRADLRVGIAAQTRDQAVELARRLGALDCPARLIHGMRDPDVPWHRTGRLAELIRSADVQCWLVKDGDHRLSREADLALLVRAVEEVIAAA